MIGMLRDFFPSCTLLQPRLQDKRILEPSAEANSLHIAISRYTRNSPGEIVDEHGAIRAFNTCGKRNPIIWIFNAAHEPASLAAALGPDQPLFALRSLNKIVRPSVERRMKIELISTHFANILTMRLPRKISLVGGNCQGAPYAVWIANKLSEKGHRILGIVSIDSVPEIKTKHPILLNFGDKADEMNPFLSDWEHTHQTCQSLFTDYRIDSLPSGHGEYFDLQSAKYLAENISNFIEQRQFRSGVWQFLQRLGTQTQLKDEFPS